MGDPVQLDFSKAQPIAPITLDFSKAQGLDDSDKAINIDDPNDPHSVKQTLPREVKALGQTIAGIPSGLFHAFKDPATPDEAQILKSKGLDPNSATDLAGLRLIKEPLTSAFHFWKNYSAQSTDQKIRAQSDILDVAPEAVGVGAAAPITGKLAEMAPRVIPAAAETMKRGALLGRTPAEAYQSALKPSTSMNPLAVERAVQTGLNEGIPVSKAGLEKLSSLVDDLNDKISSEIQSDPTRPISKGKVLQRLNPVVDKFSQQVTPAADLNAVADAGQEFAAAHPADIPAADAQAMKQGTYRQLSGKAYGELKSATIESQKALARGLKEELANAFPELKDLNARDSQLLNLEPLLEKAIQRQANHQLGGISGPVTAGATKAVTGSPTLAVIGGLLKTAVDNPVIKSRLAIALNKAGVTVPTAMSRIASYSAGLGGLAASAATANSATPDDRASQ